MKKFFDHFFAIDLRHLEPGIYVPGWGFQISLYISWELWEDFLIWPISLERIVRRNTAVELAASIDREIMAAI